jgi:flagellar assembly factor FliW
MKITTHQFGEIEFSEDKIINFKAGIVGMEELKKFLLIKTDNELFYYLNSIEQPDIAFPLVGLRILDENFPMIENYEPFGISTLNKDPLKITINLRAPVYINQDDKTGFQKILDDEGYLVNYNLFIE